MSSLRSRLLVVLLLTILAVGAIWFLIGAAELGRPETGLWDGKLRETAQLITVSIPRVLPDDLTKPGYALRDGSTAVDSDIAFQVVNIQRGQVVMRSPNAPDVPLRRDFVDGYARKTIAGVIWRTYAVTDASATIQVQVAKPQSLLDSQYRDWLRRGAWAELGIFVLLAAIIWGAIHFSLRPLERIRAEVARREPFDATLLPQQRLPNEIRPFVEAINRLFQRQEAALARERQLIADAAHELRTPLAAIEAQAQLVATAGTPQASAEAAGKLRAVAARAARLLEQLLDQARLEADDSLPLGPVDLATIVNLVVRDYEDAARRKGQRITVDVDPPSLPVQGNIDALGVLVGNLIDNAIRYTQQGGHITIRAAAATDGKGAVELSVSDDGPGIAPGDRTRIYDRFYRVAGNGERGSGIGLSLVARIAGLHQATLVDGDGEHGRGFRLAVHFPPLP